MSTDVNYGYNSIVTESLTSYFKTHIYDPYDLSGNNFLRWGKVKTGKWKGSKIFWWDMSPDVYKLHGRKWLLKYICTGNYTIV